MATLSKPEIQSRGVLWADGTKRSIWTQFADDAAFIVDKLRDAQMLLDLFHRWTPCADLTIRADKCFACAQRNRKYQHIQP